MRLKIFGKPSDRIDQQIYNFELVEADEKIKERNVAKLMRNIKISKAQFDHIHSHPPDDQLVNYHVVELDDGTFEVINNVSNNVYLVSQNPIDQCNMDTCKVKCTKCGPDPPCSHSLICECRVKFSIHSIFG